MSPTEDPIERAFRPLRTPQEPTTGEIRAVRLRAERPAATRLRRARPAIAVVALVAAAVAVGSAFDRGQPGTFVGEAGARELLRAAADASRGDAMPSGWRWSRSTHVDRMVLFGRPCATCAEERAVVESRSQRDQWTGAGGETYVRSVRFPTRVLENDALARAGGGLSSERDTTKRIDTFWWPAIGGTAPGSVGLGLGEPGAIGDPTNVPADPGALVRWVTDVLDNQRRAVVEQMNAVSGRNDPVPSGPLASQAVSAGLLDLAVAAPIAAPQRAAALNALADQPGVRVVATPPTFRGDDHVAIRLTSAPGTRTSTAQTRTVVFDRTTHQIVGDYMAQGLSKGGSASRPTISFGGTQRFRMAAGSGIRASYDGPVAVAGPGIGPDGARLLNPAETRRNGQVVANGAAGIRPRPGTGSQGGKHGRGGR